MRLIKSIIGIVLLMFTLQTAAQKKKLVIEGVASLDNNSSFGRKGTILVVKGPEWKDTVMKFNIKPDGSFKFSLQDSMITYQLLFEYPTYVFEHIQVHPELGNYHFNIKLQSAKGYQRPIDGEHIEWKSENGARQAAAYRAYNHISLFERNMVDQLMARSKDASEGGTNAKKIDLQTELDIVEKRFNSTQDPVLKQIYLLEYLGLDATQNKVRVIDRKTGKVDVERRRSHFSGDGKNEILSQIQEHVDPSSSLWFIQRDCIGWLVQKLSVDDARQQYYDEIIKKQASKVISAHLLYGLAQRYHNEEDRGAFARVYNQLVTDYPGLHPTNRAKAEFKLMSRMQVGKMVPEFAVASLDRADEIITPEKLKGKVYLIDFWAPWCRGCIMAIPGLEKLYKKYKKNGFEIVSVLFEGTPEWVADFRNKRYPMPWQHAFDPKGFKSDMANQFEVSWLPRSMLIDAEGKIIAVDAKDEELDEILNRTLR